MRTHSRKYIRARLPRAVRRAVRTRNHNHVAIQIAQPEFPMIWPCIIIIRWIPVPREHHFRLHLCSALRRLVEVVHLKPEQHSITIRLVCSIGDWPMMMLRREAVQLQNQMTLVNELVVVRAAVRAPAPQQPLIPLAARLNIRHANQRLYPHARQRSRYRASGTADPAAVRGHATKSLQPLPPHRPTK